MSNIKSKIKNTTLPVLKRRHGLLLQDFGLSRDQRREVFKVVANLVLENSQQLLSSSEESYADTSSTTSQSSGTSRSHNAKSIRPNFRRKVNNIRLEASLAQLPNTESDDTIDAEPTPPPLPPTIPIVEQVHTTVQPLPVIQPIKLVITDAQKRLNIRALIEHDKVIHEQKQEEDESFKRQQNSIKLANETERNAVAELNTMRQNYEIKKADRAHKANEARRVEQVKKAHDFTVAYFKSLSNFQKFSIIKELRMDFSRLKYSEFIRKELLAAFVHNHNGMTYNIDGGYRKSLMKDSGYAARRNKATTFDFMLEDPTRKMTEQEIFCERYEFMRKVISEEIIPNDPYVQVSLRDKLRPEEKNLEKFPQASPGIFGSLF